jgi:hypothetical protein
MELHQIQDELQSFFVERLNRDLTEKEIKFIQWMACKVEEEEKIK